MQLISFDSVTVHSQNFIAFVFKSVSINTFQIITFIFFRSHSLFLLACIFATFLIFSQTLSENPEIVLAISVLFQWLLHRLTMLAHLSLSIFKKKIRKSLRLSL